MGVKKPEDMKRLPRTISMTKIDGDLSDKRSEELGYKYWSNYVVDLIRKDLREAGLI